MSLLPSFHSEIEKGTKSVHWNLVDFKKKKKVEHRKEQLWQQSMLDAGSFINFIKSENQAGEVVENFALL